jgi:hypothetical protein
MSRASRELGQKRGHFAEKDRKRRRFAHELKEGMVVTVVEQAKTAKKETPCEMCPYMILPGESYMTRDGEKPWWVHEKCRRAAERLARLKEELL